VTMRQVHLAGEKVFIDYSGKKPCIWDRTTGEAIEVELFVAVLGASNYTFAESTRTQSLPDFCASTVRAFEYFGCTPKIAVPDQLRSAVSGPDRYDPEINPTYAELSRHYDVAIIPARPGEARDKAKVETGVLIAQRWILACRHRRAAREAQQQAVQEAGGLPALRLRDHRPTGDAGAATHTLGVCAVEEGPREHRLPRRL
jgi:transposase